MDIAYIAFVYIIIVLSAVVHEFSHAAMAKYLGDDTAEQEGRLTLNPFKHLDIIGTVVLPLALLFTSGIFLGWAKPVPYNPYKLRDQKTGNLKVAIAGPLSNVVIACVLGIIIRIMHVQGYEIFIQTKLLAFIVSINVVLALFNLIPVPPLDGSKILYDIFPRAGTVLMRMGVWGIVVGLLVAYTILPILTPFFVRLITGL